MKEMNAKFAGACKGCDREIKVGDSILWSRDTGPLHDGGCLDAFWGNEFGRHEAAQERAAYDAEMRRDEAEYQRGVAEVAQIQAIAPAGSELREALYMELDQKLYNEGY